MDEKGEEDFLSKWNPETDIIKILFSDKINDLKEQLEVLEIGQINLNVESNIINGNEKALALAKSEIHFLSGILEVYVNSMRDRKKAWIDQRKKRRMHLIEQVATFFQYKQIVANMQITDINSSFRTGKYGAIKLNRQELALLNSLNEIINPTINFEESKRVRNKKLQISVEQGMKIVNNLPDQVTNYCKGSEIKYLLDRLSNCHLFWKIPFWPQNTITVQQLSATILTQFCYEGRDNQIEVNLYNKR
ncbi:hypothetical protein ACH3XW_42155 [Acanthocheilonema viteae]